MTNTATLTPLINRMVEQAHQVNLTCQSCSLYSLCLPLGLHKNDLSSLDKIISRSRNIDRGKPLFNPQTAFDMIYVVRSGAFKTTLMAADGREQVSGFYFPGEFIGLDAIYPKHYQATASALVSSSVCSLPFQQLQQLSEVIPQLQQQMLSRLSKELSADKQLLLSLGQKTAEEKLITFFVSLAKRFSERGFAADRFELPMSRGDIANHLGMAIETVSRLISKLVDKDMIWVDKKTIVLKDKTQLINLCR